MLSYLSWEKYFLKNRYFRCRVYFKQTEFSLSSALLSLSCHNISRYNLPGMSDGIFSECMHLSLTHIQILIAHILRIDLLFYLRSPQCDRLLLSAENNFREFAHMLKTHANLVITIIRTCVTRNMLTARGLSVICIYVCCIPPHNVCVRGDSKQAACVACPTEICTFWLASNSAHVTYKKHIQSTKPYSWMLADREKIVPGNLGLQRGWKDDAGLKVGEGYMWDTDPLIGGRRGRSLWVRVYVSGATQKSKKSVKVEGLYTFLQTNILLFLYPPLLSSVVFLS